MAIFASPGLTGKCGAAYLFHSAACCCPSHSPAHCPSLPAVQPRRGGWRTWPPRARGAATSFRIPARWSASEAGRTRCNLPAFWRVYWSGTGILRRWNWSWQTEQPLVKAPQQPAILVARTLASQRPRARASFANVGVCYHACRHVTNQGIQSRVESQGGHVMRRSRRQLRL